jgi:hypothetical protein
MLTVGFVSVVFGGQNGTTLTNAPTAATATVVPEPALPQVTVPKPAQIDIPSATAVPTEPAPTAFHAQPVTLPTPQSLLMKTMQSGPTGSQNKLSAIAPPPLSVAVTNALSRDVAISPATNSPDGQPDIWHKNTPSLEGVTYHW